MQRQYYLAHLLGPSWLALDPFHPISLHHYLVLNHGEKKKSLGHFAQLAPDHHHHSQTSGQTTPP
jgi:hypothetical protein